MDFMNGSGFTEEPVTDGGRRGSILRPDLSNSFISNVEDTPLSELKLKANGAEQSGA